MDNSRKTKRSLENPIYKDRVTVLKTSEETNGDYSLGELEIYPGGGNSFHTHTAFTETFTAIKGRLGVMYGERRCYLEPGESITIPKHKPHYFFNDGSNAVICHVRFQPGHTGFEKGISIAYGLASEGHTTPKGIPKRFTDLAIIMTLTDTKPTGLLGKLFPFFKLIARLGRKREEKLLEKYYYD